MHILYLTKTDYKKEYIQITENCAKMVIQLEFYGKSEKVSCACAPLGA